MSSRCQWIAVIAGSLLSLGLLWFAQAPLGIAGEWTWNRIAHPDVRESVANFAFFLPVGLLWLGVTFKLGSLIAKMGMKRTVLAVAGLVLLSFLFLTCLQSVPPSPIPQNKGWVLYYPHSSGYFHKARYEMEDTEKFLSGYEALMAEGDVGHIGTHPPGLFLMHRAAIEVCEALPRLTNALLAVLPGSLEDSFAILADNLQTKQIVLTQSDRAALWLMILLTQFVAALTIVPLFLLLNETLGNRLAWYIAACWPLIPALSIFSPKSDLLFPLLSLSFLWLWVKAHRSHSVAFGSIAGVVFWLGSFVSLAMVPSAVIAGVYSLQKFFQKSDSNSVRQQIGLTIGSSLVAFGLPCLWMWLAYDLNLANVWWWNYRNHAAFYAPENFPRTWWKWLLANPVETLFAAGVPLFYFGVRGLCRSLRDRTDLGMLLSSAALAWGLIWLSGKNSGEAARLWIVFFPWLCLGAGFFLKPEQTEDSSNERELRILIVVQLVVCLTTITRVSGFHF
ncbi:MAG TPA: hypothetical protein VMM56_15095 [Planctomycetaceae bacterium]|nr:hypothetical protein [Planctomycetaceae bacterium]